MCEAHCFPLLTCHQTGAKAWRLSSPCALPVLTCPAHSIGGSQLSRDAELEQLWKQPEVLRKIFRCRQRGWCDADHIWEMLGKACQSGNACLLVAARPQDLPALASTGAQTACIQPASQQPRLHTLPLCSLYANLYVHLLQQQGEVDKLLQLLQTMKKR